MTVRIAFFCCCIFGCVFEQLARAQSTATSAQNLQITLDLDKQLSKESIDYLTPFHVVIANTGKEPLRIWNPYKLPGRNLWTIELKEAGVEKPIIVRHGEYHDRYLDDEQYAATSPTTEEEFGKIITLQPGRKFYMQVMLCEMHDTEEPYDRQLNWQGLPHPCAPGDFQLSITFDSPSTADAAANQVWTGRITTPQVKTKLFAHRLLTPHRLLEHHFPEAAFEMLKENPKKWVSRREGEDKSMPLHWAVRHNQLEIVQWLVKQGASVHATTASQESPLDLATDPAILKALLKGSDDLDSRRGAQILLEAAAHAAPNLSPDLKQRRMEIVRLLREAGARESLETAIYLNEIDGAKRFINSHPQPDDRWSPESALRLAVDWRRVEICQMLMDIPGINLNGSDEGDEPILLHALRCPEIAKLFVDHKVKLSKEISWDGGPDDDQVFEGQATLLHYAAMRGVPDTVRLLLDHGLSAYATTHSADFRQVELIEEIVDIDIDLDRDADMEAVFEIEIDDEIVLQLGGQLDAQFGPEVGALFGQVKTQTPLDVAAKAGRGDNVLAIIEHPQFKSAPNLVRWEALNRACITLAGALDETEAGDVRKWFTALAVAGADIDRLGHLAIQNAASHIRAFRPEQNKRFREAIATLLELGAEIDFLSAVAYGDEALVATLLAKSPDEANAISSKGVPALHQAVLLGLPKIVDLLLKSGADVHIRNQSENQGGKGETALAVAAKWGRLSMARRLLEQQADVNAHDEEQRTPLMRAIANQRLNTARLLLENGAKIDVKDAEGISLEQAAEEDKQVADLLDEFRPRPTTK